jgi:glucokinase
MILGLDIGGTKTAVVLGTNQGEIQWRKQFATESQRGFRQVFDELTQTAQEGVQHSGGKVQAISVSIGGPLNVLEGVIKSPPNLPGWDDIPLKQLLKDRFSLPVFVEHDGNAGALAEFFFGAGRGFRNIIFLTMGTGFGAGLILDGKLYRGATDVAGEVGHIRVAEDGPLCYGKSGSLEGFGSGSGIAKLANIMFPALWNESATVMDIHAAWREGSPEAHQVFERAGSFLGRGFAVLADLLNPERIILGGLGMRIGDALLPAAERIFRGEALPRAVDACRIVPADLGERIGDVASLCAALAQGSFLHRDAANG